MFWSAAERTQWVRDSCNVPKTVQAHRDTGFETAPHVERPNRYFCPNKRSGHNSISNFYPSRLEFQEEVAEICQDPHMSSVVINGVHVNGHEYLIFIYFSCVTVAIPVLAPSPCTWWKQKSMDTHTLFTTSRNQSSHRMKVEHCLRHLATSSWTPHVLYTPFIFVSASMVTTNDRMPETLKTQTKLLPF